MPKIIAIASGDWHIHKFKAFNQNDSRLHYCLMAMKKIANVCSANKVPLLFTGDLVHSPKDIENETNTSIMSTFRNYFQNRHTAMYGISGNHDLSEKNNLEHRSPTHLDILSQFSYFHKMDYSDVLIGDGFQNRKKIMLWGIPYMNNDQDLRMQIKSFRKELKRVDEFFNILMVHSDIPGAKTPEGFELNETEHLGDWDRLTRGWDLILAGHIHRPQKIGKKTYMLGPPLQHTFGEEGIKCGYWEIYDDRTIKFRLIKGFPKFRTLEKGQVPDNKLDYFRDPNDALVDEQEEKQEFALNNSRKSLATAYCDVKNIRSKRKRRALIIVLNQVE